MTKIPLREQIEQLKEAISAEENNNEILVEAMRDLEGQLQEQGWQSMFGGMNGRELSKAALNTLYDIARVYWVKNPLIQRAIEVQALYVFAQGMTLKGTHPDVDEVVQMFMKDPKNINALTSHQAWMQNERDLRLSGNQFFALFTNQSTGRVIVRSIPLYEIGDIITNPDDSREPWYYRREYTVSEINYTSGIVTPKIVKVYHPDWRYNPKDKPQTIGSESIKWDTPIMHTKVNCLPDMKYGICEVYGAIDWSKAYKTHLENGQKLWQALARFAFALTTKGGAGAVAAAKDKIKSLIGQKASDSATRGTPSPVASVFTSSEGVKLDTVKTSGATIGMDDARRHALMVASATGIPEQILMGDPSTGNLATAKAMERPLELQFINRQKLWMDVWTNILTYVIDQSIKAESGLLVGDEVTDEYTEEVTYELTTIDDKTKQPIPRTASVTFPPLLERDIPQTIQAIISGATLDGKPLAGTVDMKTLTRLVLTALRVENADELVDKYYPEDTLVMQTDYAAKAQAAAAAQALALAQQPRQQVPPGQPNDQQPPGNDNQEDPAAADDTQPPGSVKEAAGGITANPPAVENTQAFQETQAALIAARKKFADTILKGLEEHYPESTKA